MAVKAVTPAVVKHDSIVNVGAVATFASGDDITLPTVHNLHLRVANSTTAGNLVIVSGGSAPNKSIALSASQVVYIAVTDVTAYISPVDRLIHVTVPVGCTVEAFSAVA